MVTKSLSQPGQVAQLVRVSSQSTKVTGSIHSVQRSQGTFKNQPMNA